MTIVFVGPEVNYGKKETECISSGCIALVVFSLNNYCSCHLDMMNFKNIYKASKVTYFIRRHFIWLAGAIKVVSPLLTSIPTGAVMLIPVYLIWFYIKLVSFTFMT